MLESHVQVTDVIVNGLGMTWPDLAIIPAKISVGAVAVPVFWVKM